MSGVLVLTVIGVWGLLGRWVWKNFVAPRVPAARTRLAGVAFALAWFVVPVGDEILGAIEFRRLCEGIPPTLFHGPIAVGPGAFFDGQGNRKWRSEEAFSAIRRDSEEWRRIWDSTSERVILVRWPMEIIPIRNSYIERATGRVVIEPYFRGSGGGWLNEAAAAGEDTVFSSVAATLSANVEHLVLTGIAAVNGTGNGLANALAGNDAANVLAGGDGNDLRWGGNGADTLGGGNGGDLLQGGSGDDRLTDSVGNGLMDGGAGNDTLTGGAGRELFAGGAGADTIVTGGGADVIAFNRGGGADTVDAGVGSDDTLTLGGGIAYADLRLRRSGQDLVLDAGAGDAITFRGGYAAAVNRKRVVNLQVVADAMAAFNPAGSDRLLNRRVVNFDFAGVVRRFDAAQAANPGLTSFDVAGALAGCYLSGSDTAAIGGSLAYDYGHRNALADIGMGAGQAILGAGEFGLAAQTLQPATTLYAGAQRLR